tara:strand:+ start:653 stop:1423 length:771 start_codon:yes stop_codon:yes gene_type:complete
MKNLAYKFLVASSVLLFTGILFKTNHWPGASVSIVFGSLLSLFGMLFYFIARFKNKNDVKISTYTVYFYFFVMVTGTGYYSAIAPSKDLLNGFHEVNVQVEKSNESLKSLLNERSESKGMKIYKSIDLHKRMLISNGDVFGLGSKEELIQRYCDDKGIPLNKGNQDAAAIYFLVSDGGENGIKLERGLKELRAEYISILGEEYPNLIDDVEKEILEYGYPQPWVNNLCEHLPMIAVLPKLTIIQNQILHCELAMQK